MPPPVEQELNLTDDQRRELRDIGRDCKARVMKLLTDEQKRKLEQIERRGPGGRGPRPDEERRLQRQERPPGRDDRDDRPEAPPPDDGSRSEVSAAEIAWYATLESGLREAQRTGRPILLVSGAPHCAGVPGVW